MPQVPITTSVSKSRGGRISTTPLGIAQNGVSRGSATSLIPFINRDNSLAKIGQGLSAATSVFSGIAADKERIETSVQDAAEAKAEAAAKKMQAESERQQREMNAANAWDITRKAYEEMEGVRYELSMLQGKDATGIYKQFDTNSTAILESYLKDQNDDVRKIVQRDIWKYQVKWKNELLGHEREQQELYKRNAFESKMSLTVEQAADNLDSPDIFDDSKLDYQEMLEAKAQGARALGVDPELTRRQGMDIFHTSVINSLLEKGRVIDADVYRKSNKNEMTKDAYTKAETFLRPHLVNAVATEKANDILQRSNGHVFQEMEELKKISDPEIRSKTKELIDGVKKNFADQEEALINEVTQAAIANNGLIPAEYNSKLTYAQALKAQEGAAEWKSKQLTNQKKVDELTYGERDNILNGYYMQDPEKTAAMSESDIVGLMKQIGADNQEQKSIRDTWIKAKNENSKETKSAKLKELIESTDSDIKSAIHRVIGEFGYEEGTTEHDSKFYSVLKAINNNPEIKTHDQALKAARVQMLTSLETYNNIPKENHEITDIDRTEGLHFIDGAKNGDNIANNKWVKESWPERWGEIPSDLTHNFHGVEVSKNFGLVYDFIAGRIYNLTPAAPKKKPFALKGKDVEWMVRPDYPGKGGYYCSNEDKWYDLNGDKLRIDSAKKISETTIEDEEHGMTTLHWTNFGAF